MPQWCSISVKSMQTRLQKLLLTKSRRYIPSIQVLALFEWSTYQCHTGIVRRQLPVNRPGRVLGVEEKFSKKRHTL